MKTIQLNKRPYKVAESWDELSYAQLLTTMEIIFLRNYKAEQVLLRLVQTLAGVSNYKFFKADVVEIEEYFYLTAFLISPDIAFTKQLIPKYQYSHTPFYGPTDALNNLRMSEFTLTEDLFVRWCESERKNVELLDELVAILYRPAAPKYDFEKNPDGDYREKFNQNISSYYAKSYVCDWPMNVKLAIATWYNGCRLNIIRSNPEVFEGSGESSRYGMVSIMLAIAEMNVFGEFSKVEDQYVNLMMMQLNETIDKAKRIEKSIKK